MVGRGHRGILLRTPVILKHPTQLLPLHQGNPNTETLDSLTLSTDAIEMMCRQEERKLDRDRVQDINTKETMERINPAEQMVRKKKIMETLGDRKIEEDLQCWRKDKRLGW